jgi:DNA-binding response OmpR family regulator
MTHRILVVDDEPDIPPLVAYHLAKAGYRVSTASSGAEALRAASEERPDVILDLMPGVSGYDVTHRAQEPGGKPDVGVILLTARREETDRIRGLRSVRTTTSPSPFHPGADASRRGGAAAAASTGGGVRQCTITAGALVIDRSAHRVR